MNWALTIVLAGREIERGQGFSHSCRNLLIYQTQVYSMEYHAYSECPFCYPGVALSTPGVSFLVLTAGFALLEGRDSQSGYRRSPEEEAVIPEFSAGRDGREIEFKDSGLGKNTLSFGQYLIARLITV